MSSRPTGPVTAALLGIGAVAGAGTMTVELAAVRLLAPWFGASLVVWTNVIAVVLLALALGYLAGGRLSERGRPLRRLGAILVLAALYTATLPFLAGRVAGWFLPEGLALHEAAQLVLWGSLATSLVLFLPPAALLGSVSPLLVEALQERRGGSAGSAGGTVLGASTLGSLVGVFGTSLFLLQRLGLSGSFAVASGTLGVAALLALGLDGRTAGRLAGTGLLLGVAATVGGLSPLRRPAPGEGIEVLARRESPYQSIRVVEDTRTEPPLRFLQVNEGFDSYQSVWQPEPGLLPTGYYYNDFALPAYWDGRVQGRYRVLVLGLGGGTTFRVLQGALPPGLELELWGVDVDPVVVELARELLDLGAGRGEQHVLGGVDARWALQHLEDEWDLVVLDTYANQVEIPPHLCTLEFFSEVAARLAPGGWLAANLGGFGFDDPVVEAVSATCARAFGGEACLLRVPRARNYTLFARRGGGLPRAAGSSHGELAAPPPAPGLEAVARLLGPRELTGFVRWVHATPSAPVLTDDRNAIEWLQLRSVLEAAQRLREGAG